jgi:hypothetical protein
LTRERILGSRVEVKPASAALARGSFVITAIESADNTMPCIEIFDIAICDIASADTASAGAGTY